MSKSTYLSINKNIFKALFLTIFALSVFSNENLNTSDLNNKNYICLCMIVKNESKIIKRCLDSAKGIIDCVSICDTGSDDNTVEIIEEYLKENNIPGKVHRHEWQNFGHNRTLSSEAARKTIADLDLPIDQTYLLFLDADMTLNVGQDFDKNSLKSDSYLITQKNSSLVYYNLRFAKASIPWKCVGVTHEYWNSATPSSKGKLHSISINDLGDGGSKADKFERDIRLLKKGLEEEPFNQRYMFYLAQSYKDTKKYDIAIDWYKKRIEASGWKEEVWYSMYMIGKCFEDQKNWNKALKWYLKAYQYNPERAEPLAEISSYYRWNEKYDLSHIFAGHAKKINFPKDQVLFIEHPIYNYKLDEDLSISGYYTPFCKNEGFYASDNIILNKKAPESLKENTYKNLYFYVQNLKNTEFKKIDIDLPLLKNNSNETYRACNPSIIKTNDGYAMICRTVNYHHEKTEWKVLDDSGLYKTRNFLVHYDRDFRLLTQHEIVDKTNRIRHSSHIDGLEDCRLFSWNDDLWFSCTTADTSLGKLQISAAKLSPDYLGKIIEIQKLVPIESPSKRKWEKNWLPFIFSNNELYFIYSYDPFLIYKLNIENGESKETIKDIPNSDFSKFRGSAGPIEFDDGYLVMVHEVIFRDQRYYTHRFVYLDKDFYIKKISLPFTFMHKGIEFCCSMTKDHENKKLIMGIGIEDKEAYLGFVDLEYIKSILEPIK